MANLTSTLAPKVYTRLAVRVGSRGKLTPINADEAQEHPLTLAFVVTTIQPPSSGVKAIGLEAQRLGYRFFVVGDLRSPEAWHCRGAEYLSPFDQGRTPFKTTRALPFNTYSRKLIGYLQAASTPVRWIRETDDDNAPYGSFFDPAPQPLHGRIPLAQSHFINIYKCFTKRHIWPRGLPLNYVNQEADCSTSSGLASGLIVLQSVADGDPDVDAVYRLTAPDTSDVMFENAEPLIIPKGIWTPFNSQATTWPRELLPLMYLPSTCSFRMTDIWRSYVAQRLMPGLGATLVITGPTVYQDRNEHDLMRDFRDEIEGYVGYERFVDVLEATPVVGGFDALLADLRGLYEALIDAEFFTSDEMPILDAWIADMEMLGFGPTA